MKKSKLNDESLKVEKEATMIRLDDDSLRKVNGGELRPTKKCDNCGLWLEGNTCPCCGRSYLE